MKSLPNEVETSQTEILFQDKLALDKISFAYPKTDLNVFDNLDFELNRGEVVGIIGPLRCW